MTDDAKRLAESVKEWWQKHEHDTTGPHGEYNVFDTYPKFVLIAKEIIGDWDDVGYSEKQVPKIDHKSFFKAWGQAEAATNWHDIGSPPDPDMTAETFLAAIDVVTVEELYQAFKARLMAETQAQVLEDWGKQFDDDKLDAQGR